MKTFDNEYDNKCKYCDGTGNLINTSPFGTCPKCLGDGKLDWVEEIVGKNTNDKWIATPFEINEDDLKDDSIYSKLIKKMD